jgi:hypothetical protein
MFLPRIILGLGVTAGAASSGVAAEELGVPVFVRLSKGGCVYQVQDMIMRRGQMIEWFAKHPYKTVPLDLVHNTQRPGRCIRGIPKSLHDLGFTRVRVRRGSWRDYGPSPYD